jgi:hypothetical protein
MHHMSLHPSSGAQRQAEALMSVCPHILATVRQALSGHIAQQQPRLVSFEHTLREQLATSVHMTVR